MCVCERERARAGAKHLNRVGGIHIWNPYIHMCVCARERESEREKRSTSTERGVLGFRVTSTERGVSIRQGPCRPLSLRAAASASLIASGTEMARFSGGSPTPFEE